MVRVKLSIRTAASVLIMRRRWLPAAATFTSGIALAIALAAQVSLLVVVGTVVALLATSYLWGYSTRAFERTVWPSLDHLHRRQYAEVWNSLAPSAKQAAEAACGTNDEGKLRCSGAKRVHDLLELVPVGPDDEVLEIGCGVGRVGLALAPRCRRWTGADISPNMLACALERLHGIDNVRLVQLRCVGLSEFAGDSFHVVYTTDMFEHLDEMDRWRYVEEAFRVLRPGGRLYIDNISLESDAGWSSFVNDAKRYQALERPPWIPRLSTGAELMTYATRAGFEQVQSYYHPPLVIVTAVKPLGEPTSSQG